jgi:CxxC-x17-CxxC domain-containing protein
MSVLIDRKYILDMSQDRKMYKCTCADCGKDSEVPFEPKPDRPVYCKECLGLFLDILKTFFFYLIKFTELVQFHGGLSIISFYF